MTIDCKPFPAVVSLIFCARCHGSIYVLSIFLRMVPTNSKVFLRGLLNMREKQILTSVIEIQKNIGDNHAFFK